MAQLNDLLVMGQSTLLGPLTLSANQYTDSRTTGYALNMQNSNIVGVNSIYTADLSDNAQDGIHFYRDDTHVDTLWAAGGALRFVPNRSLGSNGTSYTILQPGQCELVQHTIETINAYDQNTGTYYPVIIPLPTGGLRRIKLAVQLEPAFPAKWSNHNSGSFSCTIDVEVKAPGWGTTDGKYFVYEDYYNPSWQTGNKPAYFCGVLTSSSCAVFYVRGGAKYKFICDWSYADISLFAGGYTGQGGEVLSSTTSQPAFVGGTLWSVTASSFNATSDMRLKKNFQQFTSNKSILDLPIYKFDFINGSKNQIGCKAQDLQEICPEIVNEGDDGYLSIQESKIVYLLIDEIKKLKEEINQLKQK